MYDRNLSPEPSIDYPLYQSKKGNYFIGQTPFLSGQTKQALASLVNPPHSNRNLYLNAMTITNPSSFDLSAEFYLDCTFNTDTISDLVSCANTSLCPLPSPIGEIQYLPVTTQPPAHGISIFSRIVSPKSTLVVDGGQIILGPRKSILIYIGGFLPVAFDQIRFAFGWWEENRCNCPHCF